MKKEDVAKKMKPYSPKQSDHIKKVLMKGMDKDAKKGKSFLDK